MKHIKKKFLFQEKKVTLLLNMPTKETTKVLEEVDRRNQEVLKKNKQSPALIKTTDGYFLKGFIYNHHGNFSVIPIPDFTLVQFNHAYLSNIIRKEKEKELFTILNTEETVTEPMINEIYAYYGYASICLISLFTSIESFVNHIIPSDRPFERKLNNKTELFNKLQIQESINFWDKLKEVLPFYFNGENFFKNNTPTNQHILKLKKLRDDIIHTKSKEDFSKQEELLKNVLSFKYDLTFDAVAKFINFYKPNYIEECDCGKDF